VICVTTTSQSRYPEKRRGTLNQVTTFPETQPRLRANFAFISQFGGKASVTGVDHSGDTRLKAAPNQLLLSAPETQKTP
jgi:hypothetical protein